MTLLLRALYKTHALYKLGGGGLRIKQAFIHSLIHSGLILVLTWYLNQERIERLYLCIPSPPTNLPTCASQSQSQSGNRVGRPTISTMITIRTLLQPNSQTKERKQAILLRLAAGITAITADSGRTDGDSGPALEHARVIRLLAEEVCSYVVYISVSISISVRGALRGWVEGEGGAGG